MDKTDEFVDNDKRNSQISESASVESEESQSVFRAFGIELVAPSNLKNPGIIYVAFILGNIVLFLFLRTLIFSQ